MGNSYITKRLTVRLMIGLLLMGSLSPGNSRTLSAQSNSLELSDAQLQLLKALKLKIVLPRYVPAGFSLTKVEVEQLSQTRFGGQRYNVVYEKYNSEASIRYCFSIEAVPDGVGGLPLGQQSFPVRNPALGESSIEYGSYGQANKMTLLGNWLGQGPFYRFVGAGVLPGASSCDNISAEEAVRISESLRFISPSP